jgi:DNA polymerase-1
MMTPDKDFGQLVNENVFIFKPARMGNDYEIMGIEEVKKKWEIEHIHQVIDILAIWGDAVDNIPGVPGMGEKTAKKLIKEYGSLENILENTHQFKGKQQENLINFKEQALLSKMLATININVPVEHYLDDYIIKEVNKEAVKTLFAELEFRNLTKRVLGEELPSTPKVAAPANNGFDLFNQPVNEVAIPVETSEESQENEDLDYVSEPLNNIQNTAHHYHLVTSDNEKKSLIELLLQQKEFCFDTETDGLDVFSAKIIGMSFSFKASEGYYVPISEQEELKLFKPVFESACVKIAQNLKFDMQVLASQGIAINPPYYDTMLAHYIIEPDKRHNMDDLSRQYLKYDPVSIEDLIGKKGKNQLNMANIEVEKVAEYAAEDADVTFQLKTVLNPLLVEQNGEKLFQEVEMPLVSVLASMEREGIRINSDFLNEYSLKLGSEIVLAENRIYELAGEKFNIASPLQLGKILFEKLQLDPKAKKTKTGQYQTGEDVLQKLSSKSDIVKDILEFRGLQKLKSTYVDALPALVNQNTGRIHTTFNQSIAATGRLSSTNPNLQNIPIRTEQGREVRKAFIPRNEDYLLLSADYSQIELRVIASISEDEGMMDAFSKNIDIHSATASKVFGVPIEEVSKEQRYKAKSVNFGLIYGQGAFGLSENLGISRGEAKDIIDNYFVQFPAIRNYMERVKDKAKQDGFVETIMGRRRYLRDINSANATVRAFAERNAINAPIQGTAADMIKLAMIRVDKRMKQEQLRSKMLIQVHDELLFDVHKEELDMMVELVKYEMENAMLLKVPVIAEAGWGDNWLEAH